MPGQRKRKLLSTPPQFWRPITMRSSHTPSSKHYNELPFSQYCWFCQQEGIYYPLTKLQEHFSIPSSTAFDVLQSKRAHRLQNSDEPNTRGGLRGLTKFGREHDRIVLNKCNFEEKGDLCPELAHRAGVNVMEDRQEGK
ncbi:hypothetical protein K469DRAFT_688220 [Zopfia rhizophila CBS 207.26]|uniref:Uncharacterized protein n=1 Tax=Zopfia rhizophila CBS 207.26 TaxID=1314779 RepID=A0A6A6E3C1_9PEZI|nr:hypothetical protein K469DRAFT_688220 [Zopfia rhizophila CBS 207.26]